MTCFIFEGKNERERKLLFHICVCMFVLDFVTRVILCYLFEFKNFDGYNIFDIYVLFYLEFVHKKYLILLFEYVLIFLILP